MSKTAILPGSRPAGSLSARLAALWRADAVRLGSLVGLLVVWQLSAFVLDPILIATPTRVVAGFVRLLANGSLEGAFLQSLFDMLLGFGAASVVGIALGVFMGRYLSVEAVFSPYVSFMNATPTIALLPLMIIWFGTGLWSRVAFIFVVSMWTLVINTMIGMKNVNRGYLEAGLAFGLTEPQIVRLVILPAAVPYVLAGMRIALAQGVTGMILAGTELSQAGLGDLMTSMGDYFQTGRYMSALITTTIYAVLLFAGLRWVQGRWFRWIAGSAAQQR
ncbi:MAG TPA: ABC transporter permease [Chloroflexota bacterium]|nr:ABC transporter permease [Chloroflexota bacterium]